MIASRDIPSARAEKLVHSFIEIDAAGDRFRRKKLGGLRFSPLLLEDASKLNRCFGCPGQLTFVSRLGA